MNVNKYVLIPVLIAGFILYPACDRDATKSKTTAGSGITTGETSTQQSTDPATATSRPNTQQSTKAETTASIPGKGENIKSGDYTFYVENSKATIVRYTGPGGTVTIPDSLGGFPVIHIGSDTFQGRKTDSVTALTLPGSIIDLRHLFIYRWTDLTSITLSKSVERFWDYQFAFCKNITQINVAGDNPNFSSQDGILYNKSRSEILAYPPGRAGGFSIPDSVKRIKSFAFYNCTGLTSIHIADGVTAIGENAFFHCPSLKNITLPGGVSRIENYVFKNCSGLTGIALPAGLKTIARESFWRCTNLTNITFPGSLTSVGDAAFFDCTSLKSVSTPKSVSDIGKWAFAYSGVFNTDELEGNYGPLDPPDKNFMIYCSADSAGLRYAKDNGIKYTIL